MSRSKRSLAGIRQSSFMPDFDVQRIAHLLDRGSARLDVWDQRPGLIGSGEILHSCFSVRGTSPYGPKPIFRATVEFDCSVTPALGDKVTFLMSWPSGSFVGYGFIWSLSADDQEYRACMHIDNDSLIWRDAPQGDESETYKRPEDHPDRGHADLSFYVRDYHGERS